MEATHVQSGRVETHFQWQGNAWIVPIKTEWLNEHEEEKHAPKKITGKMSFWCV